MARDLFAEAMRVPLPKRFRAGTHRVTSPDQTLSRVQPLLRAAGITRVGNITGLDHIGVPVVVACRPNARALAVSQGKGLDLPAAKASAVMEALEVYHAERVQLPLVYGSYDELKRSHPLPEMDTLPRSRGSAFHPHAQLLWVQGYDLLQQEHLWIPFELVHTDFTLPRPPGSGCFAHSSNGLASGNHPLEALSHGISEVVERDAVTLWQLREPSERAATRVDPGTVTDPACRSVLEKFEAARVAVGIWEVTSEAGVPAFFCRVTDQAEDTFHRLHSSDGIGCHPARELALMRAMLEAAQSRLTAIAGSRDDIGRRAYARYRNPDLLASDRATLADPEGGSDFRAGPSYEGDTFNDDIRWMMGRLAEIGVKRVIAVDLCRSDFGIPVVRVIIPGLEAAGVIPTIALGRRARERLRKA